MDGERRQLRIGIVIGVLVAAVAGLAVALVFVAGGGSDGRTVTIRSTVAEPSGPTTLGGGGETTSGSSSTSDCGTVKDIGPTGADPADAKGLTATGADCPTARLVATQWGRTPPSPTMKVLNYDCTSSSGSPERITCALGDNTITFYLG